MPPGDPATATPRPTEAKRPPRPCPRTRLAVRASWLLALVVLAGGCAYTASPGLLPAHLKTIAIPVFENETGEYTLEQEVTDAVVQKFVSDNHLKITDERSADCEIKGQVVSYRNGVFGISQAAVAEEYRVTIVVSVTFKDLVKNREIWHDAQLTKWSNYYVQSVPGAPAQTELDGRKAAIQKIADEILNRSIESW
jgi:hypothetical protein